VAALRAELTLRGGSLSASSAVSGRAHPPQGWSTHVTNTGFLIEGRSFHPGDALTVPDKPVGTSLFPLHAPWSRTSELIDWVREIAPLRAIGIHDAALNSVGVAILDATRRPPSRPGLDVSAHSVP
jgi:hypothetical protein